MKSFLAIIFSIVLIFSFAACEANPDKSDKDHDDSVSDITETSDSPDSVSDISETSDSPDSNGGGTNTDNKVEAFQAVTIDETVVYDENNIKITVIGIDVNGFLGPALMFRIENDSEYDIVVQDELTSVNGFMADNIFSLSAKSGETIEGDMSIFDTNLKSAHITLISNIEFELRVMKAENYSRIGVTDVSLTTKGNEDYIQAFEPNGKTVFEDENVKIVASKVENGESFWGNDIYFYIENNSEYDLWADVYQFTVDGTDVDYNFSNYIAPGKKLYIPVYFWETDFNEKGITDITEFQTSFEFKIWGQVESISETGVLSVSLN